MECCREGFCVAELRGKNVHEKVLGSLFGTSVINAIVAQDLSGGTFLRVAVEALDSFGFGRVVPLEGNAIGWAAGGTGGGALGGRLGGGGWFG